jgi:hypothetical protein
MTEVDGEARCKWRSSYLRRYTLSRTRPEPSQPTCTVVFELVRYARPNRPHFGQIQALNRVFEVEVRCVELGDGGGCIG